MCEYDKKKKYAIRLYLSLTGDVDWTRMVQRMYKMCACDWQWQKTFEMVVESKGERKKKEHHSKFHSFVLALRPDDVSNV